MPRSPSTGYFAYIYAALERLLNFRLGFPSYFLSREKERRCKSGMEYGTAGKVPTAKSFCNIGRRNKTRGTEILWLWVR